ncbi:MAG: DUF6259 domain-containing protein, partial [Verrucomicrobiales bacterium]
MKPFVLALLGILLALPSHGREKAGGPLILEIRSSGGEKIPLKVSVPLDFSEFGRGREISAVKVMTKGIALPSQHDPAAGTLTVVVSPEAAKSPDEIRVTPVIGELETEPLPQDAVTVTEKDGVITITNRKFEVRHDPRKMGGLPSSIQLHAGPRWDQFRMGDRLFRKAPTPASYYLMYDEAPGIEVLKRGPYEVVVRVTARYLDANGAAPESEPIASYQFTYDRSSMVKIHVEAKQRSPAFWNEHHVIEMGFSQREFDRWITSAETAFAPLAHQGKTSKPQASWGALASDDGGVIALRSPERIILFDGEGSIDHYLHGPWRSWESLSHSADLTLALIPSEKAKPSADFAAELASLMTRVAPPVRAWLTTPEIKRFQKAQNLAPENRHAAWLMDHRTALFPSLTARREAVEKILARDPDIGAPGNAFGIPGLTVIGDGRQSVAIQQTGDGIGIVSVLDAESGVGFLAPELSPIWTLEFRLPGDERGLRKRLLDSLSGWESVKVEPAPDGLRFIWEGSLDSPETRLRMVGNVRLEDGRSEWDLKVENSGDSILHEVIFPRWRLASLAEENGGDAYLMIPRTSGVVIKNPVDADLGIHLAYPSNKAPMQCFAHYSDRAGLYLATHDPRGSSKNFDVRSHPASQSVSIDVRVPVPDNVTPGNDWKSPAPAVLQVFSGDWFDASQIYKKWAKAEASWWPHEDKKTPRWFRDISVWCLASGAADYVVPRMKEFAQYLEVPTALHWYNWHHFPFDDNYPAYFPAKP